MVHGLTHPLHTCCRRGDTQGEIQEGLYNLLGDTGFDFMELLMANIAKLRRLNVKSVRTAAAIPTEELYAAAARARGAAALPSVTTTVRVMSESDKRLAKLMRKVWCGLACVAARLRVAGAPGTLSLPGTPPDRSTVHRPRSGATVAEARRRSPRTRW